MCLSAHALASSESNCEAKTGRLPRLLSVFSDLHLVAGAMPGADTVSAMNIVSAMNTMSATNSMSATNTVSAMYVKVFCP